MSDLPGRAATGSFDIQPARQPGRCVRASPPGHIVPATLRALAGRLRCSVVLVWIPRHLLWSRRDRPVAQPAGLIPSPPRRQPPPQLSCHGLAALQTARSRRPGCGAQANSSACLVRKATMQAPVRTWASTIEHHCHVATRQSAQEKRRLRWRSSSYSACCPPAAIASHAHAPHPRRLPRRALAYQLTRKLPSRLLHSFGRLQSNHSLVHAYPPLSRLHPQEVQGCRHPRSHPPSSLLRLLQSLPWRAHDHERVPAGLHLRPLWSICERIG